MPRRSVVAPIVSAIQNSTGLLAVGLQENSDGTTMAVGGIEGSR